MADADEFFNSYVETALWSSTDESNDRGGEPLDKNYDRGDITKAALKRMRKDTDAFVHAHAAMIEGKEAQAGHDFWLNRNGHGAGFWDGDWPEPDASILDKASKSFGEQNLYVSRGKIHVYQMNANPVQDCVSCGPLPNPTAGISAGWVIGGLAAAAGLIWLVTRSKTADASTSTTNPPLPPPPAPVNTGQCTPDAASLDVWGIANGIQIVIVTDQQGSSTAVGYKDLHAPKLYWQQADGDTFLRTQDRHIDVLGTKSYCDYLATQRASLHGVDPTAMFLF